MIDTKHTAREQAITNSEILACNAKWGGRNAIGVKGFGSSLHRRMLLIFPDEPAIFDGQRLQSLGCSTFNRDTGHGFYTRHEADAILWLESARSPSIGWQLLDTINCGALISTRNRRGCCVRYCRRVIDEITPTFITKLARSGMNPCAIRSSNLRMKYTISNLGTILD